MVNELLCVRDLKKYFVVGSSVPLLGRRDVVQAVDGVSFTVRTGESLGLVGESGCGKTTLARAILRLIEPTSGQVFFQGEDVLNCSPQRMRELRREMQIIFQDPYASLDPRRTVLDSVEEGMRVHGQTDRHENLRTVVYILHRVGLCEDDLYKLPHNFSGGQRQRIGIARALAINPSFIVADEPVSSLDTSMQAQIINLLADLKDELGLTYLFITHDLAVVRQCTDRVMAMYLGKLVELGATDMVYSDPQHPYTRLLLESVPIADPSQRHLGEGLKGEVPTPINPPEGCRFQPRCPLAESVCSEKEPSWTEVSDGHFVACHRPGGRID